MINGSDGIIFSYGQTMINQASKACNILKKQNIKLKLINMPCMNNFEKKFLKKTIGNIKHIFFLEDHNINGGFSDLIISFMTNNEILSNQVLKKIGPDDFPACGTPDEVLKHHKLDYNNLALQIKKVIKK